MELDLSLVTPLLMDQAKKSWAERDIIDVLLKMEGHHRMSFVWDNIPILRKNGLYEKALLVAYTGTSFNLSGWPFFVIRNLFFGFADRNKLLEAGDPLPGDGPFTLYRGVSGHGRARRIRGISWSSSFERAKWFAVTFSERFKLEKPAVFKAVMDKSLVLAYSNDRSEEEFICKIPPELPLKKIWPEKRKVERQGEEAFDSLKKK